MRCNWTEVFWLFVLLTSLVREIQSQRTGCSSFEFKCSSGECIGTEETCDGVKDCEDGSDETAATCLHVRCPVFAFRCTYGACVSGSAECNGVRDCADNSDETSAMCPGIASKFSINGNCSEHSMQCLSGECTPSDNSCDGKVDCKDGSDETVSTCSSKYCPSFAFRCGYGACVSGNAKCDGIIDCVDGSDESPALCGSGHKNPHSTERPTFVQPTGSNAGTGHLCYVDEIPGAIITYESSPSEYITPGEYVTNFLSISYKCRLKHLLEGPKTNTCLNGKWSAEHPTCTRYCSNIAITGITIQATCEYQGSRIPCSQPNLRHGTRAFISCQIGYQKPDRVVQDILVCGEHGEWDYHPFRCEQVCGVEPTQATPFIVGAEKINNTLVPWNVGIYTNLKGSYEHICGGTIINAKVIISAAHCFWNVRRSMPYGKEYFSVGAGKYYRDYYAEEPQDPQFFNLYELHVPPGYQDASLSYQNDIAVLVVENFIMFKHHIKPICIEWQSYSNKSIKSNLIGRVAGWGKIETFEPSTVLRAADLPTISYDECIANADPMYRTLVTGDKFCVGSENGESVCEGDSGSGFGIPKYIGGQKVYFLWGIVSNGLNTKGLCTGNYFTAFTNIQYHSSMIIEFETRYRPL